MLASTLLGTNARADLWDLGTLGGYSEATDVNADGSVIVGRGHDSQGKMRAFIWTEATGIQQIASINNAEAAANANGVAISLLDNHLE